MKHYIGYTAKLTIDGLQQPLVPVFIVMLLIALPTSSPASTQLLYVIMFLLLLKRFDPDNNTPSIVKRDCLCAKHIFVSLLYCSHTRTSTRFCTNLVVTVATDSGNRPPSFGCVGASSSTYTLVSFFPYPH